MTEDDPIILHAYWRKPGDETVYKNAIVCGADVEENFVARENLGVTCFNCKRLASMTGVIL